MAKTHSLAKLQLLLAILLAIPSCALLGIEESKQSALLLISSVPFLGLSIVTIYLGWLMVVKKEDVIYLHESFAIRFTEKTRGKQAAQNLIAAYGKPSKRLSIGVMNIISGLLCFIGGLVGIAIILHTL